MTSSAPARRPARSPASLPRYPRTCYAPLAPYPLPVKLRWQEGGRAKWECFVLAGISLLTSHGHTRDVIVKLLAFTFAMIVVPIGSYFATVNTVFKGELLTSSPNNK